VTILADAPRNYGVEGNENAVSSLESKADVEAKDWLLARKRELMRELAPLSAMHRSNGQGSPADAARKRHRALMAKRILEEWPKGEKEPSEAALERMANAHEEHRTFCDELQAQAIRYQILQTEKEEIEYRLRARETELNAYTAELKHL
jgi:hypothetical protein